ncbi:MAG: hypothetical protein KAR38_08505, partial [Calditrichia bacterium]|nr:hypothetical protein [Calditrichia bacterium]
SSFFLYHLFWYFKIGYSELTGTQNLIGIITVITISVAAALVHYREAYQTKKFVVLPFSVHLVNWFYFGLGLLLHTTGTQWKTIAILLGAIAAYFLARKARKIGIRWLYYTDTLIAQLIAIIAIITFTSWDVNALVIMGIMFLQTILFLIVMIKENEEKLYRIGTYIMQFMGIIFISSAFILINLVDNNQIYNNALILFISITVGTVFHIYSLKKYRPHFNTIDFFIKANGSSSYSFLAIIIGFMVIAFYLTLSEIPWIEYYVTLPAIILVYLRQRYQSNGLGAGIIILLIGLHIIIWDEISLSGSMSIFEKSAHAFPFLLLSFSTINWSYVDSIKKHIKWPGIYFFALHTGIITYYMFNPVSPLIPGVVYLILSLFALELANFLRNKYSSEIEFRGEPDRYLLQIGYFLIFVFLFRHVLIHLQVESYISVFKTRFLIELFAIGIFAYWAASKKPERDKI